MKPMYKYAQGSTEGACLRRTLNIIVAAFSAVVLPSSPSYGQSASDLGKLKLPPGFDISVYAENVTTARSMALSPGGIVYVGTNRKGMRDKATGKVYAVIDADNDGVAEEVKTVASGLNVPNGVAFRDGALYVAEIDRILRYDDIDKRLDAPPAPVTVYDALPSDRWHGWKFIRFAPDGRLYVPVGAPCNICDRDKEGYANIRSIAADGGDARVFARGVRNTVGFDWHPVTGELWFTDNGRDMLGDELPSDELNHAPRAGLHFGYPYCHQGDTPDPEYGEGKSCRDYRAPAAKLGPHVGAVGMSFYTGDMFPERYRDQAIIALHGSWNRSPEAGHTGYQVVVAHIDADGTTQVEILIDGWLNDDNTWWGRPVAIQQLADGSVLISDDFSHRIYRLTYRGQ